MIDEKQDSPIKGTVGDRPWGLTLAALGLDARTCQLTLTDEDDRRYRITFYRGVIVAASSPIPADTAVRVALTTKRITPAQANDLRQRIRTVPELDEITVIAKLLRWPDEQTEGLRNDVIARAAARTFAVDHGTYVLEERIGVVGIEGNVDVRAVVYLGVRMNLSNDRIAYDLRQLGAWFVLKPKTVVDLSGFGFGDVEGPILDALRGGTNLASLEAKHRDVVDPRTAQALLYALAACDAVVCCEPPSMAATVEVPIVPIRPTVSRVPTPREPTVSRVPTPREPTITELRGLRRTIAAETTPYGVPTVSPFDSTTTTNGVPIYKTTSESGFVDVRTTSVRPNQLAIHQIHELIAARTQLLDRGADHFTLLGLPPGASATEVRDAYVELARYLEPRQLQALGIRDEAYSARRLFAQICIAVTVLTDPSRRREYVATLPR